MISVELLDEKKNRLADKFTAYELAEELGLDVWDILEAFEDRVIKYKEER